MNILPVFLFLSLLLPIQAQSFTRNHATPYHATEPKWLALIRYQHKILSYESEVDSPQYFLHKQGKTNPWLEYIETKKQLTESQEIICEFPARAMLMHSLNEINKPDFSTCKKYLNFKNKLNLTAVSLIFSGYYINKPASAFGHTFFRLRSAEGQKKNNDLLDFGVDFNANVDTNNPLMYGVKGILGGFSSNFKLMPYYAKIREYNDMENRELWDYELNFTDKDLKFFVAHLFEMNRALYEYYYFTENCSYHVLNFINAIRPDWQTMAKLDKFVPPVQTIHALYNKPNVVKKIKYLPAQNKKFFKRYDSFNKKNKKFIKKIIKSENFESLNGLEPQLQNLMLDTLNDYYDYKYATALLDQKHAQHKSAAKRKYLLNVMRSKNNIQSQKLNFDSYYSQAPHNSHNTKRIKLGYLNNNHRDGVDFEMRFSFHDYMDRQIGFIPFSRSVLGRLKLKYFEHEKIKLDEFAIVNVDSLRPLHAIEKTFSWRFGLGIADNRVSKNQELNPYMNFSLGVSLRFGDFLVSSFIKTQQSYQTKFPRDYTASIGPELLLIFNNDFIAFSSEYARSLNFSPIKSYQTTINNKFRLHFSKNTSLYLSHEFISRQKHTYMAGTAINF